MYFFLCFSTYLLDCCTNLKEMIDHCIQKTILNEGHCKLCNVYLFINLIYYIL